MRIDLPFRRLLNVFILLFVVVTGAMVYYQADLSLGDQNFTKAKALANSPYNPRDCQVDRIAHRGRILDRNGLVIAYSDKSRPTACGESRHYANIASDCDTTQDTPCPQNSAYKAAIESLAPALGYYDPGGFGVTGIEANYDEILGNAPTDPFPNDPLAGVGQLLKDSEHLKTYGSDIYLTIDLNVQKQTLESFNKNVKCTTNPVSNGSIIVEDPHTGEILAMVSQPGYDNDQLVDHTEKNDGSDLTVGQAYWATLQNDPSKPLFDRPIQSALVPGSTFKTLTLIAALDSGLFTPSSTFSEQDASTFTVDGNVIDSNNLGDYTFGPKVPSFPLNIIDAYAYSDNVVYARMAVTLGKDRWLDYASRFGISYGTHLVDQNFELPVAPSWVYKPDAEDRFNQDDVPLANVGFGQGTLQITPLTMAMMVSAVAADGKLYQPHLLLKEVMHGTDPASVAAQSFDPKQIFSATAAQGVRQAMRGVVDYGSVGASGGTIAAVGKSTALIGGKTGTAQLSGANDPNPLVPHAWFVSLAPDDVAHASTNPPRLTTIIAKENGGEGACQAPIAQYIDEFTLPLLPALKPGS